MSKIVDPTSPEDPRDNIPVNVSPGENIASASLVHPSRPAQDVQLSPDQLRIRELEHQLALSQGRKDDAPTEFAAPDPTSQDNILIHFVEDGFTACGVVWCRGQEVEFTPGTPAYEDTKDKFGKSWLDLAGDDSGQYNRWGKVFFRPGEWPFETTYLNGREVERLKSQSGQGHVPGPSDEDLLRAVNAEKSRNRAAPVLPRL